MQNYLALAFITTIGMNLMCALFIAFTKLTSISKQFQVVIACCLLTSLLQLTGWQYHLADTLSASIFWLRIQTTLVLLSVLPYLLLYALWANKKDLRRYFILLGLVIFGLLILNLYEPNTLRFVSNQSLNIKAFELPWGEIGFKLQGQSNKWMLLFLLMSISALALVVLWLCQSRKSLPKSILSLIVFCLTFQAFVIVISALSNQGYVNAVLLAGFPFTLFNILCCLQYSKLVEQRDYQLDQLKYKSEALEQILVSLSEMTEDGNTKQFFANVITRMQAVSGATTGIILTYDGPAKYKKMKTAIAVHKQRMIKDFSFSFEQIPEEFRDPSEFHIVTSGLAEKYPEAEFYRNIKAQAMISAPLFDQFSSPIGVLSLYFRRPSEPDASFVNVVKVCAARLAAEYSRDKAFEELKATAFSDYLTKLPNLMGLNIRLAKNIENAPNATYILIKLDIDGFAEINRKFGFDNAELALQILGERFKAYVQDDFFIARTGGDEFTFIQLNADENATGLLNIHWNVLSALVREKIAVGDNEITLSCSGGAVIAPQQIPKDTDAMRCAEYALLNAKRAGKEQMLLFDKTMAESIERLRTIEKELKLALNDKSNRDMHVVFQPKVNNKQELVGAEALSRWVHPELGFVSPPEFIEVAESFNLIRKLGFWCVENVCRTIKHWRDDGFVINGRIGINVSAQQLEDPRFIDDLLSILKTYEVSPTHIDLELTESSLMKNFSNSRGVMTALRHEGFSISLDDFGTGYSSLSYLKDLPLDYLKIDRSFVSDSEHENSAFLIKTIVDIAQSMNLKTVAEGVEQLSEVELLKTLGCDYYQGYYFSPPLKPDAFKEWVQGR